MRMKRNTLVITGAAGLAALAVGVGGAALANANNTASRATSTPSASATSSTGTPDQSDRHRGAVAQDRGLSGDTAVKVVQAAVAKEPTAVLLRAVKADDGTYRVAMRRTDGTRITLRVDSSFAVTATQEHAAKQQNRQRTPKPSTSATSSSTS